VVETTNGAYCVSGKTPTGQVCQLLPAGSVGGEECDDGNANNDDACNNSCLWNPISSVPNGGSCGNGKIDSGEDCDHGSYCQGASATIPTPNGTACDTPAHTSACTAAGGTCQPAQIRGCSATCRNLGATAGGSQCGNGSIGDGEDCDDGNNASGDGCSADCLNEGSSRNVVALCGNGVLEPGESCERAGPSGAWPVAGCDPLRCVKTGTRPCDLPNGALCCGNNVTDPGEDCDDGNHTGGDGCSVTCLAEGASADYAAPSFCGDGILGTGEQCEAPGPAFAGDATRPAPGGDGLIDPYQIAQIVGKGAPDANGRMSSTLTANLAAQSKSGTATYGLQCGFSDETSCAPDPLTGAPTGLTSSGCCDARPKLASTFPPNRAGDTFVGRPWAGDPYPDGVCRNALISGVFSVDMDISTLQPNFIVAKRVSAADCPSGTTDVTVNFQKNSGWGSDLARAWHSVLAFFRIPVAEAQKWCAGTVTGSLTSEKVENAGTRFYFTLNNALEPHSE
jgi:cysteine-rich repeat protein